MEEEVLRLVSLLDGFSFTPTLGQPQQRDGA
jgi:hypothetical protein